MASFGVIDGTALDNPNKSCEGDDEEELSNKSSLISIVTTLSKLKRKVLINRGVDVTEKMESNCAKLLKYTNCLSDTAKKWGDKSFPEEDKLTFRSQKVLCNFSNMDPGIDGKDDGPIVAAPIVFGSSSGGKTAVRPSKFTPQTNVPPYTSWIYLDRNQRMTEDQSVQGRRRIYYDPVGNETLIASDSEEEEPEDEESKHDFTKGEDFIIWTAVQERGASSLLFEQIAQCIHVNQEEVQARYELLLKDVDKQAKCEAHGEGICSKVPSPVGRRKGMRDLGRLAFKEIRTGPNAESYIKACGNGLTRNLEEEKVEAKDLVAAMDSFDNLFCRRCLVFDCRLHGCSQPLVHPSERQPSAVTDSESSVPCGPHCHLLERDANKDVLLIEWPRPSQSQRAGGESSNSCVPRVLNSRAGVLPSEEGADGARVAKRQRTEEDEAVWVGEKKTVNTPLDGTAKPVSSAANMFSSFVTLSVNKEDKDNMPNGAGETPLLIDYKGASQSLKRAHPSVASRLTSHKKLARISRRSSEENSSLSYDEIKLRQAQRGPVDPGQGELGAKSQDVTDIPLIKKLAMTIENNIGEKVVGAVSTLPSKGVPMDTCGTEVGFFKERCKVTSPKKLARSARKPPVVNPVGTIDVQEPQSLGGLLASSQEEKRPVKEEKSRNTAARKLARSARKVFAEKVAVAIQQQQLQSQVDLVAKSQGEKEYTKEERFDAGYTHQQALVTVDTVHVLGGDQLQAKLTNPGKIAGVDSCQRILVHCEEVNDDVENKLDRTRAGTKGGFLVEGAFSKGEGVSKRDEFKDNWTALEKGLYEKGLQIFGKSSCMIANNMLKGCKTCLEVAEYIVVQEAATSHGVEGGLHQFPDSLACVLKWDVARARARFYGRRRGSRKLKFTLKSAGQSAIRKRMANGKDAPCRQYTPCGCLFTCGKQCPCQLSGTCCEKYCGCAKSCKNRFRGCHCAKSQCCSRQCPCFAAGRECDPDVCRNCWIGCGDGKLVGPPQREDKDNYQCHNMKLLLKQQQRVLLSRSDVAGWGAFLKNTVSKHEYLGEYTGELISHREADKRGKIYDRENSSFLFNLNDQDEFVWVTKAGKMTLMLKYVLDACRKGDKLKFANHSPNPNCYAKVIMVAGDHRVGIFAKERILAGEELFYDYRYEADRAPAWARRGEDSGNGKKDDSGSSERRSKQAS